MSDYDLDNLADFAEALASRERTDEYFGDPRMESSEHPDAVADEGPIEPYRRRSVGNVYPTTPGES